MLILNIVNCIQAENLNAVTTEERNFVRSKLLQLSCQKWRSAEEVESGSVNNQYIIKTSGCVVKQMHSVMKQNVHFFIYF